jgi:hypothetical protein
LVVCRTFGGLISVHAHPCLIGDVGAAVSMPSAGEETTRQTDGPPECDARRREKSAPIAHRHTSNHQAEAQ